MPKVNKYSWNVSFSQQKYIFEASEERFKHIADKFISYNDQHITKEIKGICLALSAAYLTQVRAGGLDQGERYIKGLKSLIKTIDAQTDYYDPPYIQARHKARQLHASEKLNLLFIDLISRQRLSFDLYEMTNYQPDYTLWPVIKEGESFTDYTKRIIDFESRENAQYTERFWFKELMLEIERSVKIPGVNSGNIKLIIYQIFRDVRKKYLDGYEKYYNDRGLTIDKNNKDSIANDINFEKFITNYFDNDNITDTRYFELSSENHMMAIVVNKNSETGILKYTFFDPNFGIIYFDNRANFINFLTYTIKERQDVYNFFSYNDNTYITSVIELNNSPIINKENVFPVIDSDSVNITTTKILCEEKSLFYLSDHQKAIFEKFDAENNRTKMKLVDEKSQYNETNLIINSINSSEILEIITQQYKNIYKLNADKIYLKIDNNKCFVYKINHDSKLPTDPALLTSYLSEPIATFIAETLPIESLTLHDNESLGQDKPMALESWWDPKVDPTKIPQHSEAVRIKLAESNYRHNLILQLEGEDIVSKSTAQLISKHPDSTTVIQYDLEHNRYRVVYGDISKVAGERTRWFLIGHGRVDRITNKRTFARKSAQEICDKLKNLKQTEFNNSEPDKIVLLGCKLGEAKVGDNFALDVAQQLWNEGFTAIINAYTQDLHIRHTGKRIVYPDQYGNSRQDARFYKTTFDKQLSPMGIQINNEMLIFYILREINCDNISLESETIKSNAYIKQYFYLPNGELDIGLLKLVALDERAYRLFYEYIHENIYTNTNYNINDFMEKLYHKRIFDTPLWKTVSEDKIKKNSYSIKKDNSKKIIFRFSDKKKYRQQAELLASQNPENTFVFQVDKVSNNIVLEYGQLDKLKNTTIDKWIVLGEVELDNSSFLFEKLTVENLVDVMDNIHKQHLLTIPKEICFFSKKALGILSDPYDTSAIASQFAIKLAQKNIDTEITTYQVNLDLFTTPSTDDGVTEYFHLTKNNNRLTKFKYDEATKQLLYNDLDIVHALCLDITKGNINIEQDLDNYKFYLNKYFYDSNGNLIINRVKNIVYDPIISRKVNDYFNNKVNQQADAIIKWQHLFDNNNETLNIKANHLVILLENIYYRPEIIYHLSPYSNQLLSELYSNSDGSLDIGRLMLLINDPPMLNQLKTSLIELSAIDNRSGLYTLSLSEALLKSQKWHSYYLNNILVLTKTTATITNVTIKPMPHAFFLEKRVNLEKCLGVFYTSLANKIDNVEDIWQYHHRILEHLSNRKLTREEQFFLDSFNEAIDSAAYLTANENLLTEQINSTFQQNLSINSTNQYQISIDNIIFTLIIKYKGNSNYQCQIFDPRMGEITINNLVKENIDTEVMSFLNNYLKQEVKVLNKVYKRYEIFGIKNGSILSGQFKVYKISENETIKVKINNLIDQLPIKENLTDLYKNIEVAEEDIPLFTLQQAGVYVDGNPISSFIIRNIPDWQSKLKFNIEQLNDYLTFFQGTKENISILKLLKKKIASSENYSQFLLNNADLHDFAIINERLAAIDKYVDTNMVDRELWPNIQQSMTKLPRYAPIINKLSHVTQLVSIFQLVSSTQSALMYLNDFNISAVERQNIEKNLIIAWGAAMTNISAEVLQPILFKLAHRMTGSINTASTFASRLSLGINIVSSGFDLYFAYENFDQLNTETDPARRQDLLVNGTLSLLGAGINITTALAMLAGASSAGPVGFILGTGLMISNLFYNTYRTVEEIKAKVQLTSGEEWNLALSSILGLQPEYSVRNKLLKEETYHQIEEYKIEREKKLFEQQLKPAGYNLSIIANEDIKIAELPLYHLFDKHKNLYLYKNKNKNIQYDLESLKNNFSILSLPFDLWRQQQIDDVLEMSKRKFTTEEVRKIINQYPERYQVEMAKIKTYISMGTVATNEVILLNRDYDYIIRHMTNKPYLDNYLFHNANAIYSLPENNKAEYIYEDLDSYFMKGELRKYITGCNFNFADGDDIAVGLSAVKNRFVSYSGRKIFIGGKQDDIFILAGNNLGYNEHKYFNGNDGNDTLIIEQLPRYHSVISPNDADLSNALLSLSGTIINLEAGTVRFLYQNFFDNFDNIELIVNSNHISDIQVDLENFENIIGSKDKQDLLLGNRKNNILNGNGGVDIIYGMAGKDTLILNNGYANGGEEQDTYVIERYDLNEYKKNLLWNQVNYLWNADKEIWEHIQESKPEFDAIITLDENEFEEKSIVNIHYRLDEIINLRLVENDIHINLSTFDQQLSVNSNIKLILKNAYKILEDNNLIANHDYILQTIDGFLLSVDSSQKIKKHVQPEKIFNVMYFKELDQVNISQPGVKIEINLNNNSITNFGKNYILPNMMHPVLATDHTQYSVFRGNRFDNQFLSIKNNTYIYVSHGIDCYIVDDLIIGDIANNKNIIFDFNEIVNEYTNEDMIIITLKNYSGYDFSFTENRLVYNKSNNIAEIEFINNSTDFCGKIYLVDKNNQYFNIEFKYDQYNIDSLTKNNIPTENNDNIIYTKANIKDGVIKTLAGNDIITDISETGNIILAGEGNDIITAKNGNNIVIDGAGNDIISTGDGNDVIISTQGNNIINAGKGNNVIVVNYVSDNIKIYLQEGNNKIFIQGIANLYRNEYVDSNLIISELDSKQEITIYNYEAYKNNLEINTSLNYGMLLNDENIDLLVNAAAAFKQDSHEFISTMLTTDKKYFISQVYQYTEMQKI